MNNLLELQDISKSYSGVTVLEGVNLTLAPGEVLCFVGENGAGKSTLIIEIEDRAFEGSREKVIKSLQQSKRYLEQFV